MHNLLLISILSLFFLSSALAQKPSPEAIKSSGEYYYGKGISFSENEAKEAAISKISEMISVNVSSEFSNRVSEKDDKITRQANKIIETHSMATLRNVESHSEMLPDGKYEVFSYIKKSDVSRIFDERKKMIASMHREANKNEEKGNLKYALKNNYFGLLLLNSIPEEHVVYNGVDLTQELPDAINRILSGVRFSINDDRRLSDKKRTLVVKATYNNKPVTLLDATFWAGSESRPTARFRDGQTIIHLFGASTSFDDLKIFMEYMNYNARKENKTVETLWQLFEKPTFDNKRKLTLKEESHNDTVKPVKAEETPLNNFTLHNNNPGAVPEDKIFESTRLFIKALKEKNAGNSFKEDRFLYTKLKDYLKYNRPEAALLQYEANINPTRTGYEVRRIPVVHHYPSINEKQTNQTTEYCVLDFDSTGKLVDFNLTITESLYDKFRAQGDFAGDWQQRQEILKFVEKYRTAFLTRDLPTIDKMFADDALIIVGREIKRKPRMTDNVKYNRLPNQPSYEQIRLTKEQYINRQKRVFSQQKDISIDFSTFEIFSKSNAKNVYGVEMRQNYASTTYADEGYLFLMIDFNQADPTIYIRAWQPNEWDSATLLNTANFRIYK